MFAVKGRDVLLSVGRRQMNGHVDTAVDGFRSLASVNREGSEARVFYRKIVALWELFKLNLRLLMLIEHCKFL